MINGKKRLGDKKKKINEKENNIEKHQFK